MCLGVVGGFGWCEIVIFGVFWGELCVICVVWVVCGWGTGVKLGVSGL